MTDTALRLEFLSPLEGRLQEEYATLLAAARLHLEQIRTKHCLGAEFLGWYTLPNEIQAQHFAELHTCAKKLATYDAVVVIGIGGSYLGALALAEALADQKAEKHPELIFLGFTLCADYMAYQLRRLKEKNYAVVVISKSGTTTEPAIAFRYILAALKQSRGGYASDRIVAITDAKRGTLHDLAVKEGFQRLVIPDDIGGRYSVLTPVGLLPLAVAGYNIEELVRGAKAAYEALQTTDPATNLAMQYAAWRNLWYKQGRRVEVLAMYSPYMRSMGEWYKQLYGESEGKNGGGVFPTTVCNTTDLHSLGQFFQEGAPLFFETHLFFDGANHKLRVASLDGLTDGLEYLVGKELHEINRAAALATADAHQANAIPTAFIYLQQRKAFELGYLLYFCELSCALTVLLQGNNPFDQPGVERYKQNMFHLLGKPGF